MPIPRAGLTQKGFTVLELALALAIFAIVSSLVVPVAVGMLREADRVRAEADVQQLATAVTRFYADLKRLPTCGGSDCSRIGLPGGEGLVFLAAGEGSGDLSPWYPAERPGLTSRWGLRANSAAARAGRNNAFNHLIRNDPNADGVVDAADYPRARPAWKGPYLSSLGLDPWGRAYIMAVGVAPLGGWPPAPSARAWILSAGPNGILETAPDAAILGGDDIGVIFGERTLAGPADFGLTPPGSVRRVGGPEHADARVPRVAPR